MTPAEIEEHNRKVAMLEAARAMGHKVCDVIFNPVTKQNVCYTCVAKWDDDQHFNCPNFEGIVHK